MKTEMKTNFCENLIVFFSGFLERFRPVNDCSQFHFHCGEHLPLQIFHFVDEFLLCLNRVPFITEKKKFTDNEYLKWDECSSIHHQRTNLKILHASWIVAVHSMLHKSSVAYPKICIERIFSFTVRKMPLEGLNKFAFAKQLNKLWPRYFLAWLAVTVIHIHWRGSNVFLHSPRVFSNRVVSTLSA